MSGSIAFDRIMDFPGKFSDHILPNKIHNLNVSFGLDKLSIEFGGTAGNIAYTLSLFGEKPSIVGSVGHDFAPYKKHLIKHHINLRDIRVIPKETCATAHIITDQGDNQIAGFHFGAISYPAVSAQIVTKQTKLGIIAAGNLADMMKLSEQYRHNHVPFIVDPGQQLTWLTGAQLTYLLNGAHTLVVNDYELAVVQKKLMSVETRHGVSLQNKSSLQNLTQLVVTKGEKGADWFVGGKRYVLPVAKPTRVLDPTGAGDAYRSGIILGILRQWSPEQAGRVAALCATYAIEQYGTQNHTFTKTQFKKRYYKNFKHNIII
ncbi:MAG: carbohydrate kinase family protein [Patescibacteria group bacterium]